MDTAPREKLSKFFATSRPSFYKRGDIVLRIGDARSGAFFIKKGYVKDSTVSVDGREFILFIFKPDDIFSYNWIYNEIPNVHSFKAMSDCIIYEKSREGLLLFLDENPDVQFMITQNLTARMRGLMNRMEYMAFGNAYQKVSSIFQVLSERFGRESNEGTTIPVRLTQRDIGELLGISRETANIEIKKLIDAKILHRSSGFYTVINGKKLLAASEMI